MHEQQKIRPFSKPSLIGEIDQFSLNFLGDPVYVCLYHTYENYFRVCIEGISPEDSDTPQSSELDSTIILIDLQLSPHDISKLFLPLPMIRKDPNFLTAVHTLKNSTSPRAALAAKSLIPEISKKISHNNLDFYQAARFIPKEGFLLGKNEAEKSSINFQRKPTMSDFLCRLLANLIRTGANFKWSKPADLTSNHCFFARASHDLRVVTVFVVKDEPDENKFKVFCNLETNLRLEDGIEAEAGTSYSQKFSFPYAYISKAFSADLGQLAWDEKIVIFKMLVDSIEIEGLKNFQVQEVQEEIKHKHQKCFFSIQPPATSSSHCYKLPFNTDYSISMNLFCVDGVPTGVGVKAIKGDNPEEALICLLIVHHRKHK